MKLIGVIVLGSLVSVGFIVFYMYCFNYAVTTEQNKYHCINNLMYKQINDNTLEFLNRSCVVIDKD